MQAQLGLQERFAQATLNDAATFAVAAGAAGLTGVAGFVAFPLLTAVGIVLQAWSLGGASEA